MPQKIQIIKLEKTSEYLKKEIDAVKSIQNKLLRDSDWTQVPDSGILVTDCLKWRHWRHKVRAITVNAINYDTVNTLLDNYSNSKPTAIVDVLNYRHPPLMQFDYTSKDSLISSCVEILKEIFKVVPPDVRLKAFASKARRAKTYDDIINVLIETIEDGYRY